MHYHGATTQYYTTLQGKNKIGLPASTRKILGKASQHTMAKPQIEIIERGLRQAHTHGLVLGLVFGLILGAGIGYAIAHHTIERTVIVPLGQGLEV